MREPNRTELDPIPSDDSRLTGPTPGDDVAHRRAEDVAVQTQLEEMIRAVAADSLGETKEDIFRLRLVKEMVTAGLKLLPDRRDTGELKLMTAAVKELRYAFRIFGQYPEPHKISIFGSARTPEDHPNYGAAVDFSRLMAEAGWMVITGAGDGIMKAGLVGPGRAASFGVAIRLPFETTANDIIAGDEKLIHFRYFFTRKLMFLSQAEAVALFPGGFGTMDEAFETLTLVQTGKASMVPIVLIEHGDGEYWSYFDKFVRKSLLVEGLISEEDLSLYYVTNSIEDAADHVLKFYRNYHSSRYVKDDFIIRLRRPLREADVEALNEEFSVIIKEGSKITQCGPYEVETDHLELPRLAFAHTRYKFGVIRRLIDRINELDPAE